jgi:hypothetical protein
MVRDAYPTRLNAWNRAKPFNIDKRYDKAHINHVTN